LIKHYIFVDTSAWFSLFDKRDASHKQANEFYETNNIPLITSNFILAETLTLVRSRLGNPSSINTGNKFFHEDIATIIEIDPIAFKDAWRIFQRYDDKGFSFTDCTTFAVMERLKIPAVFTFDEISNNTANSNASPEISKLELDFLISLLLSFH